MRRKISLYIADQLVDLDDQSFILFNYLIDDMGNPTIVRNSFSQTITLKGTPANNKIFGGMWRSDRLTQSGATGHGINFDASRKTSFTIYNEMGEILESGYCKLDRVTRNRGLVEYVFPDSAKHSVIPPEAVSQSDFSKYLSMIGEKLFSSQALSKTGLYKKKKKSRRLDHRRNVEQDCRFQT